MIFLSDRMTSASGSIGGTTFSHSRSGMYTRARRVPVNTNTDFQTQVRSSLTELVNAWTEVLTPGQRNGWNLYADNVPVTNALGSAFNLSGQNWYIAANTMRLQIVAKIGQFATGGPDRIDSPPVIFDRGDFTTPLASNATVGVALGINVALESDAWLSNDGAVMGLYMGRPRNASRIFFAGPYRLVGIGIADSGAPPTQILVSSAQIISRGFAISVGQVVELVVAVSRSDGRISTRRTVGNFTVTA